jgi:hypothetical protein
VAAEIVTARDTALARVMAVYAGSDGDATRALFAELELLGPRGLVAINLFRAQKNSSRAKQYRGGVRGKGSYRGMAYDRKEWAIDQLTRVLEAHGATLGLSWGWGNDPGQAYHAAVLYVDLPSGQVSFHAAQSGRGPRYQGVWDGVRNVSPLRICSFVAEVLCAARRS